MSLKLNQNLKKQLESINGEHVILVNEDNQILGFAPKSTVHTDKTPLHKAFSAFIFNSRGEILLQQRSSFKKTWPLIWSNSVCGHPQYGETEIEAAKRRLKEELGIQNVENLELVAPYRYSFVRDGVMENEICPILVGFSDQKPDPNPEEVENYRYMPWKDYVKDTQDNPDNWSEWCVEEVAILDKLESEGRLKLASDT